MFHRISALLLAVGMMSGLTGCSQEDFVRLDVDGDGIVTRADLMVAIGNYFCGEDSTAEDPSDDSGTGTGTGIETDPATDGN